MQTQGEVAVALNAAADKLEGYKEQVVKVIGEVQANQAANAQALADALAAAGVADPAVTAALEKLTGSTDGLGTIVQQADDLNQDAAPAPTPEPDPAPADPVDPTTP